jgi:hypothetical protein
MRILLIALVAAGMAGCHVYNPMISHRTPKLATPYDVTQCVGLEIASTALVRACRLRDEMEKARSQQIWVHSITVDTLIPAAGYVAYRAARQQSGAATSAIAAGGLAAYMTIGALSPEGRVEAYSRGTQALSCALGKYRIAVVTTPINAAARLAFELKWEEASSSIAKKLKVNKGDTELLSAARLLDAIRAQVDTQSPTSTVDAQLDSFAARTIEDLNGLLRGTLPSLANLGASIATLSNSPIPIPGETTLKYLNDESTYSDLVGAANAVINDPSKRASVDFSDCLMATSALVSAGLYKPMTLGPGNSVDGQTVELAKGGSQSFLIAGGQSPYGFVISGNPADKRPTASITMQGNALLEVEVKDSDPAAEHTFNIEVFDSVGSRRSVTIKVPKAAE